MKRQKILITILAGILIATGAFGLVGSAATSVKGEISKSTNAPNNGTTVRDSATVLLDGKTIPAMDYIHLYDASPYKIISGHVDAKLPCEMNSTTPLKMLIGQVPNLKPASLEVVKEMSKPGNMCFYHYYIPQGNATVTDLALQNPTKIPIKLPDTSGVVIGVNEIMPLTEK